MEIVYSRGVEGYDHRRIGDNFPASSVPYWAHCCKLYVVLESVVVCLRFAGSFVSSGSQVYNESCLLVSNYHISQI